MTIGERIKEKRELLGLSAEELAKKIGKDRATIYRYEKGDIEKMPINIIGVLSDALDCSPLYLMGWETKPNHGSEDIDISKYDNISPIVKKKIPFLGEIACGQPIFADEDKDSYLDANSDIDADFCLKCKGDSMVNADIKDGYVVFIRKQDIVDNGEIAAVIIGEEVTLKRVYYYKEENLLILRPENSKYEEMRFKGEKLNEIRILGKAIAFQGKVE